MDPLSGTGIGNNTAVFIISLCLGVYKPLGIEPVDIITHSL